MIDNTQITLKDGTITEDRRLDRIEEFDPLSLDYRIKDLLRRDQIENPRSYTWRINTSLDQGMSGACVGFAWAHELIARPVEVNGITRQFAHDVIYWEAQKRDHYLGGSYPNAHPITHGTSVLAGAKVVKDLGYISEYRWATTREELLAAIAYKGPVVFGCQWYEGMQRTDINGFILPSGRKIGRHCVILHSLRLHRTTQGDIDETKSWLRLHNSFGLEWGESGGAKITLNTFTPLLEHADMCLPIGRSHSKIIYSH